MKILVPVKRVVDYNVKVRVKSDQSGVELAGVKMAMNPFDEIAIEEAVRLKEKGDRDGDRGDFHRRRRLPGDDAYGAGHGCRPGHPGRDGCVARAAGGGQDAEGAWWTRNSRSWCILGKQAIDDDMNATGQMLAALLGWPQGTFASKVEIEGETATVTREVDGGLETVALTLPAIVTADLRLNEPRYASLPNIMKARKKPIETMKPADLGVDPAPRLTTLKVVEPPKRTAGRRWDRWPSWSTSCATKPR